MWWCRRVNLDQAAGMGGNPSSPHAEGRAAKTLLETSRERIARLLEVKSDDIIFTSGATEANALALLGRARAAKAGGIEPHMLYLPTAHASVVENMKLLEAEGLAVEALPIRDGRVDIDALKPLLRATTCCVAMDAVCGETGVVWNTREVARMVDEHRRQHPAAGITLHLDASQAPHTEKLLMSRLGADTLALDMGKVSHEQGMGLLVAPRTVPLMPLYRGGGQERGLRPGTESPARASRFADALLRAQEGREAFTARAERERAAVLTRIATLVPEAVLLEMRSQAPSIINLSLPGYDTDYVVALLDAAGVAVATKSACETDSSEGSRAVLALTGERARAESTLRISWGPETPVAGLMRLPTLLKKVLPLAKL